jgi:hypothetical protein
MNGLGYKSFFASIAITLFASNSFAMSSAAKGLENGTAVQQAVEILRQNPEVTKLVSELKSADDKSKMGLMQRCEEILIPLIILSVGVTMVALKLLISGYLNSQRISSAAADCLSRGYDGYLVDFDSGTYSCH